LLALVRPSWMIAAAPPRMILGNSGRGKCANGESSKNATKGNHTYFPMTGVQRFAFIQDGCKMTAEKFANAHDEYFLIHDHLAKVPERWLFPLTFYPYNALETTVRWAFRTHRQRQWDR
jgi:hypothetical protein